MEEPVRATEPPMAYRSSWGCNDLETLLGEDICPAIQDLPVDEPVSATYNAFLMRNGSSRTTTTANETDIGSQSNTGSNTCFRGKKADVLVEDEDNQSFASLDFTDDGSQPMLLLSPVVQRKKQVAVSTSKRPSGPGNLRKTASMHAMRPSRLGPPTEISIPGGERSHSPSPRLRNSRSSDDLRSQDVSPATKEKKSKAAGKSRLRKAFALKRLGLSSSK